jgi:hypothetical protein
MLVCKHRAMTTAEASVAVPAQRLREWSVSEGATSIRQGIFVAALLRCWRPYCRLRPSTRENRPREEHFLYPRRVDSRPAQRFHLEP